MSDGGYGFNFSEKQDGDVLHSDSQTGEVQVGTGARVAVPAFIVPAPAATVAVSGSLFDAMPWWGWGLLLGFGAWLKFHKKAA